MLESGQQKTQGRSRTAPLVIAAVLAVAIAAFAYLQWKAGADRPSEQVVLTAAARDYLPNLDLAGVEMSAKDNALGHTLVEITGKISNRGDRQVRGIRLNCVFFDVYGIELHRTLSTIVHASDGLAPTEERDFRLAFDDIPEGWNQVLPNLYVAEIVFE